MIICTCFSVECSYDTSCANWTMFGSFYVPTIIIYGTIPVIGAPDQPFWKQQFSWHYCSLQVSKACWHMIHYGGPTPKKHYALSNSPDISKLNRGKFCMKKWLKKKQELQKEGLHQKLVEQYTDSNGKKRWKGTKALRSSEWGTYLLQSNVNIFPLLWVWCSHSPAHQSQQSAVHNS